MKLLIEKYKTMCHAVYLTRNKLIVSTGGEIKKKKRTLNLHKYSIKTFQDSWQFIYVLFMLQTRHSLFKKITLIS